jgi:predicted DsbA family dithiol-disulfide isomerase
MQAFQACLDSEKYKADVERDAGEAEAQQIGVTPTFILARSTKGTLNGVRIMGAQLFAVFRSAIDELLNK